VTSFQVSQNSRRGIINNDRDLARVCILQKTLEDLWFVCFESDMVVLALWEALREAASEEFDLSEYGFVDSECSLSLLIAGDDGD
jgi:hypothetical protein